MWLTLQLLLGAVLWRCGGAAESQTQYCIIGGGPAGIQLGHFFLHAGRDYVIFEKQATAGSFFEQYPRHRKLISLNKRKVREGRSEDFAFRHDWNTLIDVREAGRRTPPVTERSKELFPHASVLVEYLSEFAEEQNEHIRYNSSVQKIQRQGSIFELTVASPDSPSHRFLCVEVIIATGLAKPRLANLRVDGAEHVLGYEDLPSSGESFEGQAAAGKPVVSQLCHKSYWATLGYYVWDYSVVFFNVVLYALHTVSSTFGYLWFMWCSSFFS